MHAQSAPATGTSRPAIRRVTFQHLRNVAQCTGLLVGIGEPMFRVDDNDRQICRVVVTRRYSRKGHPARVEAETDLDAVFTGSDAWWDSTRATQAEVTAAVALRSAFPELAGLLTADELEPDFADLDRVA